MQTRLSPETLGLWREHVGRREVRHQTLDLESLRRFAVAVGGDPDVERQTPPLAHWAWFLEAAPSAQLSDDGHPKRLGLLPPVTLPRRMFASGAMRFHRPLILGAEAELELTVADVAHRLGRTGDLVFVEVDRVLRQSGAVRLTERQTLVYRDAEGRTPPAAPAERSSAEASGGTWTPSSVDLFRFSAATFNGHRIHYDQGYARDVEGYPDLVVQGPQTAARLFAVAARGRPNPPEDYRFRALAPAFVNQPLVLKQGEGEKEWVAVRRDGVCAMSAEMNGGDPGQT